MVLYLHHVPGRLRVRLSALERNAAAASALRSDLLAIPGVLSAVANSWTGSITIHYDRERIESAELWSAMWRLGYIGRTPRLAFAAQTDKADAVTSAALNAIARALASSALEYFLGRSAGALVKLLI
jgi:hypothetical protein